MHHIQLIFHASSGVQRFGVETTFSFLTWAKDSTHLPKNFIKSHRSKLIKLLCKKAKEHQKPCLPVDYMNELHFGLFFSFFHNFSSFNFQLMRSARCARLAMVICRSISHLGLLCLHSAAGWATDKTESDTQSIISCTFFHFRNNFP